MTEDQPSIVAVCLGCSAPIHWVPAQDSGKKGAYWVDEGGAYECAGPVGRHTARPVS